MGGNQHDGVPIRADMATIINGPMGISESKLMSRSAPVMSSEMHHKRAELKRMLIGKLCKVHGSDELRKAVVTREVETSSVLKAGKLTPDGLRALEKSIEAAVAATKPGPPLSHNPGRADPAVNAWQAGVMAAEVKKASNWTDVALHRSKYYIIEQERKAQEFEKRKVELRNMLAHQNSLERHKEVAARQMVQEERQEIDQNLKEFHADVAKEKAARERKAAQQKRDRDQQLAEQAARAAAAVRLQKLEDEELLQHLEREKQKAEKLVAQKKKANAEYHRTTKLANQEALVQREQQKQIEWANEMKLNAEWKAMLDKQEHERNEQYRKLRERIHAMQRVYESNAGAEDAAREEYENNRIELHAQQEEARAKEEERLKAEKRREMMLATKTFNNKLLEDQRAAMAAQVAKDKAYAEEVRRDALAEEQREKEKKALMKARSLQQTAFLNQQVKLQMENAANDPGASEMTALEACINRPLLVSVVQHKYPNPSVLN